MPSTQFNSLCELLFRFWPQTKWPLMLLLCYDNFLLMSVLIILFCVRDNFTIGFIILSTILRQKKNNAQNTSADKVKI